MARLQLLILLVDDLSGEHRCVLKFVEVKKKLAINNDKWLLFVGTLLYDFP